MSDLTGIEKKGNCPFLLLLRPLPQHAQHLLSFPFSSTLALALTLLFARQAKRKTSVLRRYGR